MNARFPGERVVSNVSVETNSGWTAEIETADGMIDDSAAVSLVSQDSTELALISLISRIKFGKLILLR